MVGALISRGGLLMRNGGLVFVTRDGCLAPRWRVFVRNLVMWAPLVFSPWLVMAEDVSAAVRMTVGLAATAVYGAGVVIALKNPARGLQDRLAGTWMVPK